MRSGLAGRSRCTNAAERIGHIITRLLVDRYGGLPKPKPREPEPTDPESRPTVTTEPAERAVAA